MQLLSDLVRDKAVALVGNAQSIFGKGDGEVIDGHDVVIRMNAGYPKHLRRPEDTGYRTDVWASAKPFSGPTFDAKLVLFMKLTKLGDEHWPVVQRISHGIPTIRWPRDLEQECLEFVGADPGTGIRLLWWLKKKANPLCVACFGMDCWETKTHWSGKKNTPNHSPSLERLAMDRLLA